MVDNVTQEDIEKATKMLNELNTARSRVAALEKALRPLAAAADDAVSPKSLARRMPDQIWLWGKDGAGITLADAIAAKKVLDDG